MDSALATLLRAHGLRVESVEAPREMELEYFAVDSTIVSATPFQGHRLVRVEGRWRAEHGPIAAGSYVVPTAQPLGVLAVYLLEPESDDGAVAWGLVAPGAVRRF